MTIQHHIKSLAAGVGAAALLSSGSAEAGDWGKALINDKAPIASNDSWNPFWVLDNTTLYEGDGFIRKIRHTGRYHGNLISTDKEVGVTDHDWHHYDHRRFRIGLVTEFANNITLTAITDIADGVPLSQGRFIDNWDELNIKWAPKAPSASAKGGTSPDYQPKYLIIGKQKQNVTREFEASSNRINVVEARSSITSEVGVGKPWGITYGFDYLGFSHELGAWLNGADLDSTGEGWLLPDFNTRAGASYRISTDISEATRLHFDYAYTNNSGGTRAARGHADTGLSAAYEHVLALGTVSQWDRLTLLTDVIYGANRGAETGGAAVLNGSDTWGLVIQPSYAITKQLDAVFRYAYLESGREYRYQDRAGRQNVEDYHTYYAGLAYKIHGHKLKVLAGYEHASGNVYGNGADIDSGSWQLGLRASW